jgi:DtxR family transcriptional regulator, Mn-dependent transcriptional regulator
MLSTTEENYLKAIFKIAEKSDQPVGTNAIAVAMDTTAASVTDMLKRLTDKQLLLYERYRGVQLTPEGTLIATLLIRRHRLWETFLVNTLHFSWDAVHDLAEQLEHVADETLTHRLDQFLGYPRFDPHGDPIPDADGQWIRRSQHLLADIAPGQTGTISAVEDHTPAFLQYLTKTGIELGSAISVIERLPYDHSTLVRIASGRELLLSEKVCQHLYVAAD